MRYLDRPDMVIIGIVLTVGCILAAVELFVWSSLNLAILVLLYYGFGSLVGYPLIAYAGRRGWLEKEEKAEVKLSRTQISAVALVLVLGVACITTGFCLYFL